jgi:hypothetical protein
MYYEIQRALRLLNRDPDRAATIITETGDWSFLGRGFGVADGAMVQPTLRMCSVPV